MNEKTKMFDFKYIVVYILLKWLNIWSIDIYLEMLDWNPKY